MAIIRGDYKIVKSMPLELDNECKKERDMVS